MLHAECAWSKTSSGLRAECDITGHGEAQPVGAGVGLNDGTGVGACSVGAEQSKCTCAYSAPCSKFMQRNSAVVS